jgi:hypothetical protein
VYVSACVLICRWGIILSKFYPYFPIGLDEDDEALCAALRAVLLNGDVNGQGADTQHPFALSIHMTPVLVEFSGSRSSLYDSTRSSASSRVWHLGKQRSVGLSHVNAV